jgi:uncharacterized RDD family membrane protein YckC
MTREDHLNFCSICTNRKLHLQHGLICKLTDAPADFESTCSFFNEDAEQKSKHEQRVKETEVLSRTASKGKRFANYMLDIFFYLVFSFLFGVILGLMIAVLSPNSLGMFEQENKLLDYALGLLAGLIYYSLFEFSTGRTLGKFITRTKVIMENGDKPDFKTIFIRSLCRFIPFEPFSFLGSENTGWHDRFSKTLVVNA